MNTRKKIQPRPSPFEPEQEAESDACASGSIEQQLDMCETGPLRGESFIRQSADTGAITNRFQIDMSEVNREGDEMSGDEHSSGLQGGDSPEPGEAGNEASTPGVHTRKTA